MTGCCVSWKCLVACLPVEESQQPTWPHAWHSRRATQNVPSTRHSSHALGVLCGGKSPEVTPSKCSHNFAICFSSSNHIHEMAFRSVDSRLLLLVFVDQLIKSVIAGITCIACFVPQPMPRAYHNLASDIGRHSLGHLNQEIAARLLAGE